MNINNDMLGLDLGVIAGIALAGLSYDVNSQQTKLAREQLNMHDDFHDELMDHLRSMDDRNARIELLLKEIAQKL